jgi:hypothetical protein
MTAERDLTWIASAIDIALDDLIPDSTQRHADHRDSGRAQRRHRAPVDQGHPRDRLRFFYIDRHNCRGTGLP